MGMRPAPEMRLDGRLDRPRGSARLRWALPVALYDALDQAELEQVGRRVIHGLGGR